MEVDKELFLSQVKQYNTNVEGGVDVDYGKDPEYLMPIATPPFYCGLIRGALEGLYSGGVKTDRQFRGRSPAATRRSRTCSPGADGGTLYNNMYGIDINGSMTCHGVNSARTAANTAQAGRWLGARRALRRGASQRTLNRPRARALLPCPGSSGRHFSMTSLHHHSGAGDRRDRKRRRAASSRALPTWKPRTRRWPSPRRSAR